MKILKQIAAGLVLLLAFTAQAQSSDEAAVKKLVDSQNFVFVAQTVFPMGGPSRTLTSDYDVRVTTDSLITYLPYFGRAYAPILPSETGISFTSAQFSYEARAGKKGGWEITIYPKDTKEVRQMNLSVSKSGYASLQITSTNKQAISYYGYLKERQ